MPELLEDPTTSSDSLVVDVRDVSILEPTPHEEPTMSELTDESSTSSVV